MNFKQLFKYILINIGYIFSFVFPHSFLGKINECKKFIYTGFYKRFFHSFGYGSLITPCFRLLIGPQYISIGQNASLGSNIQLTAWDNYLNHSFKPQIIISDNCSIGDDSHITAINKIIIKENVLTGKKILITDNAHGMSDRNMLDIAPLKRPLYTKGGIVIEENVWIGEKVSICGNVRVGRGCIIAANSVVTKDIPPYCVVAGSPAKIVKTFDFENNIN